MIWLAVASLVVLVVCFVAVARQEGRSAEIRERAEHTLATLNTNPEEGTR